MLNDYVEVKQNSKTHPLL